MLNLVLFLEDIMENKLYLEFFKIIEQHSSICIFGHIYPDGDCYASSQGLKYLINYLYPEKKVYVLGTDISKIPDDFPHMDDVEDSVIENSLVICVDLPDKVRVSDSRAFSLKNLGMIKIDHHIFKEHFGQLEIIEDEASSCAEIIAKIFYTKFDKLPKLACDLLYYGFTTDTNRFMYANNKSALIGAKLLSDGADANKLYSSMYVVSESSIRFNGYLYSHYQKTDLGVCYCIVPYKDSQKYGYNPHQAAIFVNSLGRINASKLWCIIAETSDGKAFCEFRSLGNIDVQQIASKFTGGGHLNASGCTLDKFSRYQEVIDACQQALLDYFSPYQEELKTMLELAKQASKVVMEKYKSGFSVEIKNDNSPVTSADLASNKIIKESLSKKFPDYAILSEEDQDDLTRLNKEYVFIIDPLDGTKDFVNKDDMFAINIALVKNHQPVIGVVAIPAQDKIYFAVKDKGSYVFSSNEMISKLHVSSKKKNLTVLNSSFHKNQKYLDFVKSNKKISDIKYVGSALKSCLIAQGKAEVCYSLGLGTKEWDTCAPQIVLEEAGGKFLTNHLNEITYNRKDVYNRDGFTALNSLDNKLLTELELEEILKK